MFEINGMNRNVFYVSILSQLSITLPNDDVRSTYLSE